MRNQIRKCKYHTSVCVVVSLYTKWSIFVLTVQNEQYFTRKSNIYRKTITTLFLLSKLLVKNMTFLLNKINCTLIIVFIAFGAIWLYRN